MQRLLLLGALLAFGVSSGAEVVDGRLSPDTSPAEVAQSAPLIVQNASDSQDQRLREAVGRFKAADLALPPLTVLFHDDEGPCHGHPGLFSAKTDPWEVHICTESVDIVYEHELAHAWVAYNLTDQQRKAFMDVNGYETWNDKGYPWSERGTEGAALVIQQGISGLPLSPVLSDKTERLHVEGYRLLTGVPSARYVAWLDTYSGMTPAVAFPGYPPFPVPYTA